MALYAVLKEMFWKSDQEIGSCSLDLFMYINDVENTIYHTYSRNSL